MLSLSALIVMPYLVFVCISERLNPFSKPMSRSARFRWRYAKQMAVAVFSGIGCTILLREFFGLSFLQDVIIGTVVAVLLAFIFAIGRVRREIRR